MEKISIEEAIKVIKEWGVNCDNFVAYTYRQYLINGEPYDDSEEKAQYFLNCLKLVCDLGIKAYNSTCTRPHGPDPGIR